MDVPGIMTRYVDDCAAILNLVAGHDPLDSTSIERPFPKIRLPPGNKIGIKNVKIGIPVEYHCKGLSSEVLNTWNKVAKILENNGAEIKEVI